MKNRRPNCLPPQFHGGELQLKNIPWVAGIGMVRLSTLPDRSGGSLWHDPIPRSLIDPPLPPVLQSADLAGGRCWVGGWAAGCRL